MLEYTITEKILILVHVHAFLICFRRKWLMVRVIDP